MHSPLWSVGPFVLMLLSIAVVPLVVPKWWDKTLNKLLLGFLLGVPFQWTLKLLPIWATALGAVLIVFNIFDQYVFNREDVETPGALIEDVQPRRRLHIEGKRNFLYLLGVMAAAILSG